MSATTEAAILVREGKTWWRCQSCQRTLGELVGGRVVVKVNDRRLSLPRVAGLDQVCPRCGCLSVLPGDVA